MGQVKNAEYYRNVLKLHTQEVRAQKGSERIISFFEEALEEAVCNGISVIRERLIINNTEADIRQEITERVLSEFKRRGLQVEKKLLPAYTRKDIPDSERDIELIIAIPL